MSDISKLPKWAQVQMRDLQRQRETAVKALEEWADHQTVAPFSVEEMICTTTPPSFFTRYVQGHKMTVKHAGVEVRVLLRDDTIEISYAQDGRVIGEVMMQPFSYQQVRLFAVPKEQAA